MRYLAGSPEKPHYDYPQIKMFGQLAASIFAKPSLPLNTAYDVEMGDEKKPCILRGLKFVSPCTPNKYHLRKSLPSRCRKLECPERWCQLPCNSLLHRCDSRQAMIFCGKILPLVLRNSQQVAYLHFNRTSQVCLSIKNSESFISMPSWAF